MSAQHKTMTPERVIELKAEAKATKASNGGKQTAILAEIAKREGFRSWEELIAMAGGRDSVDAVKAETMATTDAGVRRDQRRSYYLQRKRGAA